MNGLFNPIEFGFRDLGGSQFGHTFRNEIVDIRRVYTYHRRNVNVSPDDEWKIKYINSNKYIFEGKIPNKKFALDLLINLDSLPDDIEKLLKRDIALENLLINI